MVTINDLAHLTAPQKTIANNYLTFAENEIGDNKSPIPPVGMTYQQAKRADEMCREMNTLIGKIQLAARYVLNYRKKEHQEEFDVANP